jgi:hypothetical protein
MNRRILLAIIVCLLTATPWMTGKSQTVFVDPGWPAVCVDSVTWVDVRVDSMIDSIHSYACLIMVDTSYVYLDSVHPGTILDTIFGEYDTVWFGWEYDQHFPDSLYFGASIFGAGAFVNGPGQLARIWLTGKRPGISALRWGWCVIRDPYQPSGPGMDISYQDDIVYVLGPGIRYGDANDDGVIHVGDAVYILNYLYKNGPSPLPWWFTGDANCDKTVGIGDAIYLLNYLFRSGSEPCRPCG